VELLGCVYAEGIPPPSAWDIPCSSSYEACRLHKEPESTSPMNQTLTLHSTVYIFVKLIRDALSSLWREVDGFTLIGVFVILFSSPGNKTGLEDE
jgi:hypothetical protein